MPLKDPLADCIANALHSSHRDLAQIHGKALRYPQSVAPFAAIDENTTDAMNDLAQLLQPGEAIYLLGEKPVETPGLHQDGVVACLQWLFPPDRSVAANICEIEELSCANSGEMLDLITIAFPGYFRRETCRMGRYFGIRHKGKLIAMGGERMVLESDGLMWREISALCTHPEHTGRRYGTALLHHIIRKQRDMSAMSWLHVVENNSRAINLYRQLGFQEIRRVELHRVVKDQAAREAS
jgi:GNAT superfamily N-acetyltransferase